MNQMLNKFFTTYSGQTAMVLSIISGIIMVWRQKHSFHSRTRKLAAFFLFWPSLLLAWVMVMHLCNNLHNAIVSISAGQAVFSFYHYSLQLFGITVGYQTLCLLRQCLQHARGEKRLNGTLYLHMGRIVLTTLPAFIFMPMAIIPQVLMVFTMIASLVTHRAAGKQIIEEPALGVEFRPTFGVTA